MSASDRDLDAARPLPEALLDAAAREGGRGRLKIFLGAAPGVGKTYEMLTAARARRADRVDVVIGVVETHNRPETAALVEGFEVIPQQQVAYRDHALAEMDLDAILARRPGLVLVDELAHSNAPGSRHPKRHLDVEELVAAGIDVYTTLNIQHVESLNDVAAQITRVRVRETVPDFVLDRADDIEIVDLSPDDLIQRLHEGKVYVPENAVRALENYFSPGNLTALRELALRRTAQRVDDQLLSHMQAHAIPGPWAAGERVLVCVDDAPSGAGLVRYAKRLADRFHAPWTGLYVETARSHGLSEEARDRVADCLRLVEHLGGEAATLPGGRIAEDILDYARANNITQIVIGKSDRPRWFETLHGSVVHDLVRRAGAISVHVIAGDAVADAALPQRAVRTAAKPPAVDLRPYGTSLAATAVALGIGMAAESLVGVETIDLIFLTAVLGIATAFGLGPSLLAGVAASLAYNFFFLPPLYTFTIADPTNVAAFLVFLLVAIVVSNLASRVRTQMLAARSRARTTEALYGFSRKIAGVIKLDDLLWAAAYQIASMLKLDVLIFLAEGRRLELKCSYPPEDELDDADLGAAKWAFENNRPAGHGADTLPGARRLFLPLRTGRGTIGVVGLTHAGGGVLFAPDEQRLLDALMDQAAVAIERVRLTDEMDAARMATETERLRSALLASLSHDLKTPLASIIGAITALRQYDALYDAAARDELAGTIQEEAERLGRFVVNLLDMARLEAGTIALDRSPIDVAEVIGTALQRTAHVLAGHPTTVERAADLPMLMADPVLLEQVLVNLLDNAAKHAPTDARVTVAAAVEDGGLVIRVLDRGPGIPPADLERIFEKFYRVRDRDRRSAGTGLGLAICRGFVEALGGRITAVNRTDGAGAVLAVSFPPALLAPPRPATDAAA